MSEAITLVEIDIDFCSLTYGVGPCTAAASVAILDEDGFPLLDESGDEIEAESTLQGIQDESGQTLLDESGEDILDETSVIVGTRCYNTFATCQDRPNFTNEPKTLRYSVASANTDKGDIDSIPSLVSVRHKPGRIRIGQDLGERASVTCTFEDHRHSDIGVDPYVTDRTYDPLTQGTYWGRFVARNPFIIERPLRVYHGRAGDTFPADFERRDYLIESMSGPGLQGSVQIVAKDPLRLADGDQAQAPAASTGLLDAGISDSATSLTLAPAGIGAEEYSGVTYVAINREICEVTNRTGDVLTIVRGQLGTEAQAHDADDTVQVVLEYTPQQPSDILADLLLNYANVDASWVDTTEWNESDTLFVGRNFTGYVAEPTPVKVLISEILEQAGANMWWSETEQRIRYEPLRVVVGPPTVGADQMISDSFKSRSLPEKRLSQVWTYYGQINPLEPDEPRNYRAVAVEVDGDAESANEYGRPSIRKLFSRWVAATGRSGAQELNARLLARRRDPPRQFEFSLARYASDPPEMGDTIAVQAQPLQDAQGLPSSVTTQVISVGARFDAFGVVAEEFRFTTTDGGAAGAGLNPSRPIDIVNDTPNVNLWIEYLSLYPNPTDLNQEIGSVDAGTDTITINGHGYQNDARLIFVDAADLPAPFVAGTTYYVINQTANTFQLSATEGGAAINITDAGTGTNFVRLEVDVPVTIDPNIQVYSTSSANPALTVGNFVDGVNITLRVREGAYIIGKGGEGGDATFFNGLSGEDGGTALFTRYDIDVENDGTIAGGGGGGGAGGSGSEGAFAIIGWAGAGGGGAGRNAGGGGASGGSPAQQAANGTLTTGGPGGDGEDAPADPRGGDGGDGGDLGQAGGNGSLGSASGIDSDIGVGGSGGAAGTAIDGDSQVTLTGSGTVTGPQVN